MTWLTRPAVAVAAAAVIGYVLGSLPFAVWVGRAYGVDPRRAGDRNPGASNVWVVAGRRAGVLVGALDVCKGALASLIGLALIGWPGAGAAMVAAMVGHAWPWWSRFRRGGRSVAVLVGAAPVLAPAPAGIALLLFVLLLITVGFRPAAGAGLLVYPPLVASLVPDSRRLIPIGLAYALLLLRGAGRHPTARAAVLAAAGTASDPAPAAPDPEPAARLAASAAAPDPGLCGSCRHAQVVTGAHSRFWLCLRSRMEPAFPRYPRLPVRACPGHEDGAPTSTADGDPSRP